MSQTRIMVRWGGALAMLGALALGCGAVEKKETGFQYHAGVAPAEYYPLEAGWAWSYDVTVHDPSGDQQILSSTHVVSAEGDRRVLRTGNNEFTYRIDENGILKEKGKYHLLRGPIAPGQEWILDLEGMQGTLRIVDVHATVETPAGTFHECVITEESVPSIQSLVVTAFAPGVGIAKIEEFGVSGDQRIPLRGALLKGFSGPE